GWSDTIFGRNIDREGAAMNQPETGEAPEAAHGRSDLHENLAGVLRQRAAISAGLRGVANFPRECQPQFQSVLGSGSRLARADRGAFRLVEEAGFRLVAEVSPDVLEEIPPPVVHGSFHDRLIASKSPVQIPDVAAHELYCILEGGLQIDPGRRVERVER